MNETSRQKLTAPIRRVRFVYVAMIFCFWAGAIAVRLMWLQVVQHGTWVDRAKQQQQRTFEVAPHRGVLYDRNMKALAMTVLVDSIYAVPSELGDNRSDDAALLARVVHADPLDGFTREKEIDARFNASKHFAWVARKVTPEIAARVQQLNLKGIYLQKEFKRFYPNGDLSSHVLGYVGTDDNGLGGLEAKFDDELHGESGHELTAIDAKRHVLGSDESDPIPGENLELTIDSNIQYMAERALDKQMAKVKASHGTIVVQDPNTGQILALAVSPRFNPNDALHVDPQDLTDLAVSDVYEPGSTFKLVTYAAAVDAAGVKPMDMVDCQGGAMTMFGRTLHDDKSDRFGVVTVKYALEHSSDVGAAKMALKLGPDKFYKYMRGFGFGDRSGIELPSETRGLLAPPRKWGSTSILSMAIGQEVAVTPVQLVTMVSAIANGGMYLPPHILLQSSDALKGAQHLGASPFRPADELPATLPDGAHRVISERTALTMREMMAGVVSEGTGKAAQLNGYSSAGKTGTAQKVDPVTHTYSHTKVVASFAGFAPVNHPAISVTVVIDQPTVGILYGAEVSAPVFREVAQEVLEYLGVPHDQALKTPQQLKEVQNTVEPDDVPDQHLGDLSAEFDEVNSLPADDPLRQPQNAAAMAQNRNADEAFEEAAKEKPKPVGLVALPDKVLEAIHKHGGASAGASDATVASVNSVGVPAIRPQVQVRDNGAVVVDPGKRVAVPDFHGNDLRAVVEHAGGLRLRVRTLGSGLAQDQAPIAGTMVPLGTEIVVRFAR